MTIVSNKSPASKKRPIRKRSDVETVEDHAIAIPEAGEVIPEVEEVSITSSPAPDSNEILLEETIKIDSSEEHHKNKKKNKGKDKKKDKKNKEAVIIRFEMTQLKEIDQQAEGLGLSRAAWVRMVVARALSI